jgi:ribosome biogenesis GTPase
MAKKKKIRADFRKNRTAKPRSGDWTRKFAAEGVAHDDTPQSERVSGKGELTRKRTIIASDEPGHAHADMKLDVNETTSLFGRVIRVHGLLSTVDAANGKTYRCATRRLLKTLSTDERHVVSAGDCVWFRPEQGDEGIIERVEPRHGVLSRTSRGRKHTIVTNVDQLLIVTSAAEPYLKPNLIDRLLVSAEKCGIRPIICINKIDLVDPADLQPLIGVYSQLGYRVILTSAATGFGIDSIRQALRGRESAVAGQSGVGKSSLLNAIEQGLHLRVAAVSAENQKGRHTTTTAQLLPLAEGGYVVDTPGIRQFQLWDVVSAEVASYFRDLRPFVSQCRFPDCTHTHEEECTVKEAVADDLLDARRYESYLHMVSGFDE